MDLDVYGLCLGGNVFGWTADRDASFAVLDAYVEAGGNFIDTADTYMRPNMGISETIIGEWMAARGNRDAAGDRDQGRLRRRALGGEHRHARRRSLRGCRPTASISTTPTRTTASVPVEETVRAFDALVRDGKVPPRRRLEPPGRAADRVAGARPSARAWRRTSWLQPHYNLVERERYEREYAPIVAAHGLAVAPYYALASGFLTGKYRAGSANGDSPRADTAAQVPRRARRGGAGRAGRGRRRARRPGRRGRRGLARGQARGRRPDRQRAQRSSNSRRSCRRSAWCSTADELALLDEASA